MMTYSRLRTYFKLEGLIAYIKFQFTGINTRKLDIWMIVMHFKLESQGYSFRDRGDQD